MFIYRNMIRTFARLVKNESVICDNKFNSMQSMHSTLIYFEILVILEAQF